MNDIQFPGNEPSVPEDLRSWVGDLVLLRHVFEALQIGSGESKVDSTWNLPTGRARVLLSLLTYAYASGTYGSDEIERQCRADPQLRYLSARTFPNSQQLRRFRRAHRNPLQHCLRGVLLLAWQSHSAGKDSIWPQTPRELPALFEWCAHERIERAVLTDSMALDI